MKIESKVASFDPELLEVLKIALERSGNSTWMEDGKEVSVHGLIRAAIAKAEGK